MENGVIYEANIRQYSPEGTNGDETANRLLYVIGSRAKKNLYLISETGRKNWKNESYFPTNVLPHITHHYDEL